MTVIEIGRRACMGRLVRGVHSANGNDQLAGSSLG